jgi:hypothetical protein
VRRESSLTRARRSVAHLQPRCQWTSTQDDFYISRPHRMSRTIVCNTVGLESFEESWSFDYVCHLSRVTPTSSALSAISCKRAAVTQQRMYPTGNLHIYASEPSYFGLPKAKVCVRKRLTKRNNTRPLGAERAAQCPALRASRPASPPRFFKPR